MNPQSSQDAAEAFSACPMPRSRYNRIVLGHGSGGSLSAELLESVFLPAFDNRVLRALEDQATLALGGVHGAPPPRIALTTDAYVVRPLFFPGGDIGKLAIHGTINDLAVGGARPLYIAAAFILEEGLALTDLERIVASMRSACDESNVALVAGDTKVVDRGKCDQVFITTTGIGLADPHLQLSIAGARPGDAIIVSGSIGDHGIALMSVREGLEFETAIESDSAALTPLARLVLDACPETRLMRDPTRGGLASALNELAKASRVGVKLDERSIPVRSQVRAACELLGLDPLHVANEGKLIAVVPEREADRVVAAMRRHPLGQDSAVIGAIVADHIGTVVMKSVIGGDRLVAMLSGEQLPRIC